METFWENAKKNTPTGNILFIRRTVGKGKQYQNKGTQTVFNTNLQMETFLGKEYLNGV